jgi:hypothetical protein
MAIETREVWFEGQLQEVTADWGEPPEFVPDPVFVPRTYKSDMFDRCASDAEAQAILDGVAARGVRLKAFFDAVHEIRHDHPLFTDLKAGFTEAFGPERADELLAPSA